MATSSEQNHKTLYRDFEQYDFINHGFTSVLLPDGIMYARYRFPHIVTMGSLRVNPGGPLTPWFHGKLSDTATMNFPETEHLSLTHSNGFLVSAECNRSLRYNMTASAVADRYVALTHMPKLMQLGEFNRLTGQEVLNSATWRREYNLKLFNKEKISSKPDIYMILPGIKNGDHDIEVMIISGIIIARNKSVRYEPEHKWSCVRIGANRFDDNGIPNSARMSLNLQAHIWVGSEIIFGINLFADLSKILQAFENKVWEKLDDVVSDDNN